MPALPCTCNVRVFTVQTDCHLRLTPKEDMLNPPMAPPTEDPLKGVTDDQWRRLRTYLGLHRLLAYNLPDHIRSTLEKDFVDMRKTDPDTMNADAFHMLLCIARYVSVHVHARVCEREREKEIGENADCSLTQYSIA